MSAAGKLLCLVLVVVVVCTRLCAAVPDARALIIFTGDKQSAIREQWFLAMCAVFRSFKAKIGAKKIFAILRATTSDVTTHCNELNEAGEVILSASIDKLLLLYRIKQLARGDAHDDTAAGHNLMLFIFGHGNDGTIPFARFINAVWCSANSFEESMRQGLHSASISTPKWPHTAPDQAVLMNTILSQSGATFDTTCAKAQPFCTWKPPTASQWTGVPPGLAYARWMGSIAYAGHYLTDLQYIQECGSVNLDVLGSVKLTGHDIIGLNKPWNNLLVFNVNCYGGGMFSLLSAEELEHNKIVNFAAAAPWHPADGSYFFLKVCGGVR